MTPICIKKPLETFYLCSQLPIGAFDERGNLLHQVGHNETSKLIFETYFSWTFFKTSLPRLKEEAFLHYTLDNGISFTLCPLSKTASSKAYCILGPYTLKEELKTFVPFKPHYCILHLLELLYQLLPSETTTPLPCLSPCKDEAHSCHLEECSYHITRAKKYLEELPLGEVITLDQVVDHLGIGKSYFCRLFKKTTGQTFSNYLSTLRITASQSLLQNSNLTILEIAFQCGFSSASYYTTTFKKIVGQTPQEYRNQLH